jgi:hypothetical protein
VAAARRPGPSALLTPWEKEAIDASTVAAVVKEGGEGVAATVWRKKKMGRREWRQLSIVPPWRHWHRFDRAERTKDDTWPRN